MPDSQQHPTPRGLLAAVGAHTLWGLFPMYFHLLSRAGALEIVAHRLFWTLVLCVIACSILGLWSHMRAVFTNRRLTAGLFIAGVLVSSNWLVYVYAVVTDRVVEAALGYFINPLITVVIAVLFLRESLRRAQLIALGIGLAAVLVIVIGYGQFPWLGLGLSFTFAFYSLSKKKVGAQVSPIIGLGVETLALAPASAVYIVVLEASGTGSFLGVGPAYTWLLVGTGVVTAIPLLLFAVGAARLRLATLAMVQYVTPIIQFIIGVWIMRESMPTARWVGFILVWIALIILTWDMARSVRKSKGAKSED